MIGKSDGSLVETEKNREDDDSKSFFPKRSTITHFFVPLGFRPPCFRQRQNRESDAVADDVELMNEQGRDGKGKKTAKRSDLITSLIIDHACAGPKRAVGRRGVMRREANQPSHPSIPR